MKKPERDILAQPEPILEKDHVRYPLCETGLRVKKEVFKSEKKKPQRKEKPLAAAIEEDQIRDMTRSTKESSGVAQSFLVEDA